MASNAVWATLLTQTDYLVGTLVLDFSLREVASAYPLVVMVTPSLPETARDVLRKRGIQHIQINPLMPQESQASAAEDRFRDTWTKLQVFSMTGYSRVVLLDSDMLVTRNMDELMTMDLPTDWIAAAHVCACNPRKLPHYPKNWIPENCAHSSVTHPDGLKNPPQITPTSPEPYNALNSGLVVLHPSPDLFNSMVHYLAASPDVSSWKFPDQDLLASYFKGKWKVLPWCYNALKPLRFVHAPLWRDEEVRCLHYILPDKPWLSRQCKPEYQEVHSWWWQRYDALSKEMALADPEGYQLVQEKLS